MPNFCHRFYTFPAAAMMMWALAGCASVSSLPLIGNDRADSASAPIVTKAAEPAPGAPLPAPVPEPRLRASDLVGLTAASADAMIGQGPVGIIREGRGEIRRYTNQTCALLVILYPDDRNEPTVKSVESSSLFSSAGKPDLQSCLGGF